MTIHYMLACTRQTPDGTSQFLTEEYPSWDAVVAGLFAHHAEESWDAMIMTPMLAPETVPRGKRLLASGGILRQGRQPGTTWGWVSETNKRN